jgi:hypothetical protein
VQQSVVVRARHHHVHVVVPGDEPAVADGTEQGAVGQVVGQSVGAAQRVQLAQDAELDGANLLGCQG